MVSSNDPYHYDAIRQSILTYGYYPSAAADPDDGIMVKYGRDAHQGYKPDIIVSVQVEFYNVIVRKSVLFGEVPERPPVKAADALVGGEPYKPLPVLYALVNDVARAAVLYAVLFVRQVLAAAAEGDEDKCQEQRYTHADGSFLLG